MSCGVKVPDTGKLLDVAEQQSASWMTDLVQVWLSSVMVV